MAPHPAAGVRFELEPALEVELVYGVDEPEDAIADQIGLLDVSRQSDTNPTSNELHQRGVVEDQRFARSGVRCGLEAEPQVPHMVVGAAFRHAGGFGHRCP